MTIEALGVYWVEATEPVHLIELSVTGLTGELDVGEITQETTGEPKPNWQVPWGECFLNESGTATLRPTEFPDPTKAISIRVAFFFHYLRLDRPLLTPAGPVALPAPSEKPARLSFMEYEAPC